MITPTIPTISGRKGGGGSTHTPTEDPNTLQSNSTARIIDWVSEGPCVGLVAGRRSIYLNGTPIESSDGTVNFQGVSFQERHGEPTQAYVKGFSASENEVGVDVQVKQTTPVVRTVSNLEANACRVTIAVQQLVSTNRENGDIHGATVEVAIDVQPNGGAWREVLKDTISGKTTSPYQRSHRIALDGHGPWNVRLRRITPDSKESSLSDVTQWHSYAEIVDGKFSWPDIAYVGLKFDARAFGGSIPSRSYDVKGLIISVPSNYNPETREYVGIWDGSFKQAWSDNPAWIFYDLLTNQRYGMGLTDVDRYGLYTIAKYCDELVPDGFGGKEPRFTLNTVINSRQEAYAVLNQVASAFRGMFFWAGDTLTAVQDAPKPEDGARVFGPANVINGKFAYQSSSDVARHTVANVTWNDPAQQFAQTVETVEDPDSIQRYGWNQTDLTAYGCTSRGQARRLGLWLLYSEREETQTVKFSVGVADADLRPGQVISISDPGIAGARLAGRIKAYDAGRRVLTLDQAPAKRDGQQWKITIRMPDNSTATRECTFAGAGSEVTLSEPLPQAPVPSALWMLSSSKIGPQLYRVVSLVEGDDGVFEVDAIEHHRNKYALVEEGLHLDEAPVSLLPSGPIAPPLSITARSYTSESGTQLVQCMTVSWVKSADPRTQSYVVSAQGPNDVAYRDFGSTTGVSLDLRDVPAGEWRIRVRALDGFGQASAWASLNTTIGSLLLPAAPSGVDLFAANHSITLSARTAHGVAQSFEFWRSNAALDHAQIESNAVRVGEGASVTDNGLKPGTTYFYYVRGVNIHGRSSWYPVQGQTSNNFDEELAAINQDIKRPGGLYDQIIDGSKGHIGEAVNVAIGSAVPEAVKGAVNPIREQMRKNDEAFQQYQNTARSEQMQQNLQIALNQAAVEGAQAAVETESMSRATADGALSAQITRVHSELDGAVSDVTKSLDTSVQRLESGMTQAAAQANTDMKAAVAAAQSEFNERIKVQADDQLAQNLQITLNNASLAAAKASIATESISRATADGAMSSQIVSVRASMNDLYAEVTQVMRAEVDAVKGTVNALWSVKTETSNGKTAAVGLQNNGKTSEFGVLADRFYVMSEIGGDWRSVFTIDGGRTFINSAMIKDASIDAAKFTDTIRSSNFQRESDSNFRGFEVNMRDGKLYAQDAVIRGAIEATSFRCAWESGGFSSNLSGKALKFFEGDVAVVELGVFD